MLTVEETDRVRDQLGRFAWYREALETFRSRVDELIARSPAIPIAKGRAFYDSCPEDNSPLVFDPYQPRSHVCPVCGHDWQGQRFDLAWVRHFQEWHAKRLVEAGVLYRLEGAERHATYVRNSLRHFTEHYDDYPLANNLLGPTRLFQSTYMEAFWLVDMVAAYDLTRSGSAYLEADHSGVRDLFYASCGVVRSYDEGVSNRQAFNNAGMGAVALLYADEELLTHVLEGPHGFAFHMRESLLEDGLWYEGENYHFATLDHLLDLAEMARHRGIDLYRGSTGHGSLRPMFDGPLKVMLPDLSFPSRKDAWFGRSVAELKEVFELGYARYGDERFGGLLADAYDHGADRSDLAWRSFLYLRPELPSAARGTLRTVTCEPMPGTGVAILRRDEGRTYASIEYGNYGGGHGHPDRLHLTLFAAGAHWLLDPGTGWYHVPELGWYRSTLAHNTLVVDGASQTPSQGALQGFGDAGGFQAAQARVAGVAPGVAVRRSLCLGDGFLLDILEATGEDNHRYDLAFHTPTQLRWGQAAETPAHAATLGDREGYEFLTEVDQLPGVDLDVLMEQGKARLRLLHAGGKALFRARSPSVPRREGQPLTTIVARAEGRTARFVTAYVWGGRLADAHLRCVGDEVRLAWETQSYTMVTGEGGGVAVLEQRGDRPERLAWFGLSEARLGPVHLHADRRLGAAALTRAACGSARAEGELQAELPPAFGAVEVEGFAGSRVVLRPAPALPEPAPSGSSLPEPGPGVPVRPSTAPPLTQATAAGVRLRQAQRTALWSDADPTLTLHAGCSNALAVFVASYAPGADGGGSPSIDLPAGWRAVGWRKDGPWAEGSQADGPWAEGGREADLQADGMQADGLRADGLRVAGHRARPMTEALTRWTNVITLPASPKKSAGQLIVEHDQERLSIPYQVAAPFSVAWRVTSHEGSPELVLDVMSELREDADVSLDIDAPWLLAPAGAAARSLLRLPAGDRASARWPLPTAPVPAPSAATAGGPVPTRFGAAAAAAGVDGAAGESAPWRLQGERSASGEYPITATLRLEGFIAETRPRLPLAWATAAGSGAVATFGLNRAEQALWADRPWGGPNDASATASVAWNEEGLRLACQVQDDIFVTDASSEDLYENDSVQVYFDCRPRPNTEPTYSPGVAAYVLAPTADRSAVEVRAIAGNREISNRSATARWFTTEGVLATCRPTPSGYAIEATFPYASLGFAALSHGDVIGFDLALSDNDGTWYRNTQLVWSGARGRRCYIRGSYHDPREFGWLIVGGPRPLKPDGDARRVGH